MDEIKNAKLRKHKISLYWLVPIVALITTVILIWENSFNKGPLVSLHMEDASGIEAGKTVVKFRSVDVNYLTELKEEELKDLSFKDPQSMMQNPESFSAIMDKLKEKYSNRSRHE